MITVIYNCGEGLYGGNKFCHGTIRLNGIDNISVEK